jgi:hypothetical protein
MKDSLLTAVSSCSSELIEVSLLAAGVFVATVQLYPRLVMRTVCTNVTHHDTIPRSIWQDDAFRLSRCHVLRDSLANWLSGYDAADWRRNFSRATSSEPPDRARYIYFIIISLCQYRTRRLHLVTSFMSTALRSR